MYSILYVQTNFVTKECWTWRTMDAGAMNKDVKAMRRRMEADKDDRASSDKD